METMKESKTRVVDEFLARHGAGLPGHVVDFALDVRTIIAELEEELARLKEPEPVG
ncbi:MAG: hypothetical protein KatS3mg011_1562 [Acidimicrobiia bacterium]|jgi:hypothetical protein|nr:MAG: hypothetical protein KatS3mg011_1562 [Acidimicrobiia bacterium]